MVQVGSRECLTRSSRPVGPREPCVAPPLLAGRWLGRDGPSGRSDRSIRAPRRSAGPGSRRARRRRDGGREYAHGAAPSASAGWRRPRGPRSWTRGRALARDRRDEFARLIALELGKPVKDGRGEMDRVADTFAVCAAEARQHRRRRAAGRRLAAGRRQHRADLPGAGRGGAGHHAVQRAGEPPRAQARGLVRRRQHHHRQGAAAGAGGLRRASSPCCWRPARRSRRCSCCTAAATSGPRCAACRRSAWSASPAAPPRGPRSPARPAPSGSSWSWAATPRRSCARTPTSPRGRRCAPAPATRNSGQSCISVQRVYVHRSRFAEFVDAFTAEVGALVVGDPLDPATDVGSMVDDAAAERVVAWAAEAAGRRRRITIGGDRDGATLRPDGRRRPAARRRGGRARGVRRARRGAALRRLRRRCSRPATRSRFGLQAGLFTRDIGRILTAWRELEVGGLVVNGSSNFRLDHVPFGGVKDSGFGRESPAHDDRGLHRRQDAAAAGHVDLGRTDDRPPTKD